MALNERQKKFCEFYAKCGNATEAAIQAGYSEKSAGTNADKLLKNTNVSIYLEELSKNTRTEAILSIAQVKEFWCEVINAKEQEMPHRLKASELLVKASGGFLDKVEHSGEMKVDQKWQIEFIEPKK